MTMKTCEDYTSDWDVHSWMYAIHCSMLDVLNRTLVWIGVAAIHLDYSSVDLAARPRYLKRGEENSKYVLTINSVSPFKLNEMLLQKDKACQSVCLIGSMNFGIMSYLGAGILYALIIVFFYKPMLLKFQIFPRGINFIFFSLKMKFNFWTFLLRRGRR